MPNFYQILSIEPTATAEDVKRAFRLEIARYHPDKVQHLGEEFQQMAAARAALLTEAYRTLMNAELRAEYDRLHLESTSRNSASAPPPSSAAHPHPAVSPAAPVQEPPPASRETTASQRFASERRDRDDFVRRATIARFRQALTAEFGAFEELPGRGFDLHCATSTRKLFSRDADQRFALRFVPHADGQSVQDAWDLALKVAVPICVFLLSTVVAPVGELSEAIAGMRRKGRGVAPVCLVPVDLRDWSAHVPTDAPTACRGLLTRLRDASRS